MPDDPNANGEEEPPNRGRIQAQGERTEQSVAWAQKKPPTRSEMLEKCSELEAKLTRSELKDRRNGFAELRGFIEVAANASGVYAGPTKSFPRRKKGASDIRVDFQVIKGLACVPDPVDDAPEEEA